MLDYIRVACAVPMVQVGDVTKNVTDICEIIGQANEKNTDLLVFPELAVTGYSCADLFFQRTLLDAAETGLAKIAAQSQNTPGLTVVVGAPLRLGGQLYNCGAVISDGAIRGIVPKLLIPNYNEFYEGRWFTSGADLQLTSVDGAAYGQAAPIPVGRDLLFRLGDGALFGVEICEDLWTPLPPSTFLTLAGAEVVVNLSASNEIIGKRTYRRELVKYQSGSCCCVYAFCSAGSTESSQDLIYSGHSLVAENGTILTENTEQIATDYVLYQDADLGRIRADRQKNKSFGESARIFLPKEQPRQICWSAGGLRGDGELYQLQKLPFVPQTRTGRLERCMSVFEMQVGGLVQRLRHTGAKAVIGVSGGLDSTLSLLVAVEAMRKLGRPLTDVHGVTMPCFGTSDRTYRNSQKLMATLGISAKEIRLQDAVQTHFRDIGHNPSVHNGTYENSQARERTQILMDYAGMIGGLVVGTGDLSELALGWCTYNGDHMSMYGVNASIPKTLIRWMIEAIGEIPAFSAARPVLLDVLDTPISPELLPPDAKGQISQQTEELVGPYALHDFYLYYMLRFGFSPEKIYTMACRAFDGDFPPETIKKWLKVFYHRFFSQQFKRSCLPDGVKVGSVCLSPRGDWRMPSDAAARIWLDAVDAL